MFADSTPARYVGLATIPLVVALTIFSIYQPHRPTLAAAAFAWRANLRPPVPVVALPRPADKYAIVVNAAMGANTTWIEDNFDGWGKYIYVVDDPDAKLTTLNRGHEGSAYLTFVIDYYDSLPDYTVFSHARRYQWHNDDRMYDGLEVIKQFNFESVDKQGYVNLRCAWGPGCDPKNEIRPRLEYDEKDGLNWPVLLGRTFKKLLPDEPVPEYIGATCCAQFVISRDRIRARPKADYEHFRDVLWNWHTRDILTEMTSDFIGVSLNFSHPAVEGQLSGNMFENLWHILFGMPADTCAPAAQCYCANFNKCAIDCPADEPGKCVGQFWYPPMFEYLNDEWPAVGQGVNGWPWEGWWDDAEGLEHANNEGWHGNHTKDALVPRGHIGFRRWLQAGAPLG